MLQWNRRLSVVLALLALIAAAAGFGDGSLSWGW